MISVETRILSHIRGAFDQMGACTDTNEPDHLLPLARLPRGTSSVYGLSLAGNAADTINDAAAGRCPYQVPRTLI